jgi:hypothetical protein
VLWLRGVWVMLWVCVLSECGVTLRHLDLFANMCELRYPICHCSMSTRLCIHALALL